MNPNADKLFTWLRSKVELSTFVPLLLAAVTFVGHRYYGAYFEFYAISSDDVELPMWNNVAVSVAVAVFTSLLMGLVYYSQEETDGGHGTALRQNVPLFVIVLLITIVGVDIYWSNVEEVSSWLASLIRDKQLLEDNRRLTERVESTLRWMIVVAPFPVAALVTGLLSVRRWSFSRFMMTSNPRVRLFFFIIYLALVLRVCGICGRAKAMGEFVGLLAKPDVVLTLTDGHILEPNATFYLIGRGGDFLYLAERSTGKGFPVNCWVVPRGSIKYIQAKPHPSVWKVLLDYFRKSAANANTTVITK